MWPSRPRPGLGSVPSRSTAGGGRTTLVVARRDGDVGASEEPFDEDHFAHVVSLMEMAEELQEIAQPQQRGRPPPQVPTPEPKLTAREQHCQDRERYTGQVQPEREPAPVSLEPLREPGWSCAPHADDLSTTIPTGKNCTSAANRVSSLPITIGLEERHDRDT